MKNKNKILSIIFLVLLLKINFIFALDLSYEDKMKIYNEINTQKIRSIKSIIFSLILWTLYTIAYLSTIIKVKYKKMPIDVKSFTIFWLTSGWMILVNWLIPGSFVYFLSFTLALFTVYLHLLNTKNNQSK